MESIRDKWRTVEDLARDLLLAQEDEPGRGRTVFLVGAGCSVSAGIPAAGGVARECAVHLARKYSRGEFDRDDADSDADHALRYLVDHGHVDGNRAYVEGKPAWGSLYPYFFADHLKSPNQQRDMIYDLVKRSGERLNWAHACLGELVRLRFVNSVLTTNFDQLVLAGIIRTGLIPVVADGMFALNRIVAEPLVPQVVHLHGSMHTYALRNSPKALDETSQDHRAVAMLNGILQRANLLVVVGYAGGEEGLMKLLLQAASSLEQLVIYWVTYEDDAEKLSDNCRELLSGENKFAITGGEADRFFGQLMARLGIGQPKWVADPIGELMDRRDELVPPEETDEVSMLIRAYRDRVEAAAAAPAEVAPEDPVLQAAGLRAEGRYVRAREMLEGFDFAARSDAARLHALNALSVFEESNGKRGDMLQAAIAELSSLIAATAGRERLENVISLLDAKFDEFENSPGDGTAVLAEIVDLATTWLTVAEEEGDPSGHGRLLYYRAQAHHRRADATDEDQAALALAIADYQAALGDLSKAPDQLVSPSEVREGLAAALQVLGVATGDVVKVRAAVKLFREVADHSRRNAKSAENGGMLYNFSGALLKLMAMVDPEEAQLLAKEARTALRRAEAAFSASGPPELLAEVRASLEGLDLISADEGDGEEGATA